MILRDHFRADFANAFQLGGKIDKLLPVDDLFDNFFPNSFDLAQIAAACREDLFRRFENLEQLAQPHRPHRRKHVQRNAGFRGVHMVDAGDPANGLNESVPLERNLVVVRSPRRAALRRRAGSRWTRRRPRHRRPPPPDVTAKHLHRFTDYLEFAAFLSRLLIVPGVELQTSLDKHRASFLQILAGDFRRASPKGHVNKGDFFAFFPVVRACTGD